MKTLLRKIFSPILNYFESGDDEYNYKPSHRIILNIVGCLFLFLSSVILIYGFTYSQMGSLIPGIIFLSVSIICIVVGSLGNERAVSKIWGNK
jgi:hypothetical protein